MVGNLFGVSYRNKVKDFKERFDREKDTFYGIISLETAQTVNETANAVKENTQAVDNIGMFRIG